MTTNERCAAAEAWIEAKEDLAIWVHVGHTSQLDAIHLARHAQEIGAKAISALAPFYFTPSSVDELIEFLIPISKAASELPFYYYHIPSMTHVPLNVEVFIREAITRIPSFVGLKFSSQDLYALQMAQMAVHESGIEILYGVDEMLLGALPLNINGAIGSTYNFASPLYQRLLSNFQAGDMEASRILQSRSAALVREFHSYGGIATGKAIMEMLGRSCGPPRPPLSPLTQDNKKNLYRNISELDIFPFPLQSP